MRILVAITAVFLSSVAVASSDLDTRFLQGLGSAHYQQIESETLGRPFHLYIMLPQDYEEAADQRYPTIYLLDGGNMFPLLASFYRYLQFGDGFPNAIIVGVAYGSDTFAGGNYRASDYTAPSEERDFWGGAGKFQQFLSDELFPTIESSFRSRDDRRIIFGQSIGGQFVLYTALTQPDLFWGHIASNPALHRNLPFFLEEHWGKTDSRSSKLFVASGSLDDPMFRVPALKWAEHWSGKANNPWQLEVVTLEGQTHLSAPPEAFRQGMRWLFSAD